MNNLISSICFIVSLIAICIYVFLKRLNDKEFSFANTFPFESNKNSKVISTSIVLTTIFTICSIFFYVDIYFETFKTNYILLASIASAFICVLFMFMNVITLVGTRKHFLCFSLFAALTTTESIILGFSAINNYKISGTNVGYIVLAVIFFLKAFVELLLISPIFKFSFLMDVNIEDKTIKKPKFIRLAFYEWVYLFLFIGNTFLLFLLKII